MPEPMTLPDLIIALVASLVSFFAGRKTKKGPK